jgi:hypothetical protein
LGASLDVVDLPVENTKKKNSRGKNDSTRQFKTWTAAALERRGESGNYYIACALKLLGLSASSAICPWGRKLIPYPDFNEIPKCFEDSNKWFFEHYSVNYIYIITTKLIWNGHLTTRLKLSDIMMFRGCSLF